MKKDYNLPNKIISSGYVNINSEKMSKSKGNLMTANELIETYDSDSIRYYLIANGPEKKDVNFSIEDYATVHNKFLVGVLGNFVNRNLSFIKKKFDSVVKAGKIDSNIINLTKETYNKVGKLIEEGELRSAADVIMDYVTSGNKYYDENEPWNLAKNNIDKFNDVTYTCVYMMANIANLIEPLMPKTSNKISELLKTSINTFEEVTISGDIVIGDLPLLFNRIEQ
jgi:methionyl-tRNA synthetase